MEVSSQHRDLEQVRGVFGHVHIETTQVYAQIQPELLKQSVSFYEARSLDALIDSKQKKMAPRLRNCQMFLKHEAEKREQKQLWRRLLGRPVSESGTLCQGDGLNEGAIVSGRHGPQGNPVQFPDSHCVPTSIPSEFPRIAVSGRALGQDEIGAAIQTTSTSKVRRVDFGDCGSLQPLESREIIQATGLPL